MDQISLNLQKGTNKHLQLLQKQSQILSQKQDLFSQKLNQKSSISSKQSLILKSIKKRDELIKLNSFFQELKTNQKMNKNQKQKQKIEKKLEKQKIENELSSNQQNNKNIENQEELEARKLLERISGCQIYQYDKKQLAICFDIFYNGKFINEFLVILQFNHENDSLEIFKHSLPYFIPIENISVQFLNKNFHKFKTIVKRYLDSFVARKQQMIELENQLKKLEINDISISSQSESYNFISISLDKHYFPDLLISRKKNQEHEIQSLGFQINLFYEKLDFELPTKIEMIEILEDHSKFRLKSTELDELFKNNSIIDGLKFLIDF
ncbi:inner kinetochore subunit mal2 [Anaeramoeba ignava]|uniref:Inner kinetochore subunit mal2 n=1 Tax=Anaeramoeba ignava TaxID=1746090 RepID=A0A9Q0R9S9_ANAIG|nr:inner kinetochore subunit mal2 [Anaeramoeba ignava]